MARDRIGIFGGSFDPIHIGHLVVAMGAQYACRLDKVLLMVANEPWQKAGVRTVSDAEARFRAVAAAVAKHPALAASRLEMDRGGVSYTLDTLVELAEQQPGADLYLIVGSDTANRLETWWKWEEVADRAELVVVNRPGNRRPQLDPRWHVHEVVIPAIDVSSTDLRQRFYDGRPLDYLIPEAALKSLRADGLYPGGHER